MIKINRQTDYAIRVVLALARRGAGLRVSTSQVQKEMSIPAAFLQRIVADLAHAKVVRTFPGREGGLELARPIPEISLKDVVEAIEGPLLISECLNKDSRCVLGTTCPVQACWGRVQAAILRELDTVSFAELAAQPAIVGQ